MTDDKLIVDELSTAYKTEVAGYQFYSAAADMVSDEKGKNIFTHLAAEELDHVKVVWKIAESIKSGMGWISYEDAVREGAAGIGKGGVDTEGAPIFPEVKELLKRLEADPSDLNAVHIAMESEEEAVDFYLKLLNGAESPAEKTVLTNLLEMEKAHLKVLRWEAESLSNNGCWCGNMEFSVEKEAD